MAMGGEGNSPYPRVSIPAIVPLMRQVPGRHIAVSVAGSPEIEVGPVDL
jgi:hypothetical protein